MTIFAVRALPTIVLLAIVWQHAHWSVALSLSLFAIANEVTCMMVQRCLRK